MVVIEELEHAKARGAKIYAELLGYGVSSDANHVSDPDPTGENPARALTMAFADAGIVPEDVGYVNAHGTSTPSGDSGETRVLKVALGEDKAYRTPISSTKGATGHCLGAAGAVEAIFTILALERGILPPTINQTTPDPTCDLDYIPNEARHEQVEIGVSNSFGFGGHNACLVFRRWQGRRSGRGVRLQPDARVGLVVREPSHGVPDRPRDQREHHGRSRHEDDDEEAGDVAGKEKREPERAAGEEIETPDDRLDAVDPLELPASRGTRAGTGTRRRPGSRRAAAAPAAEPRKASAPDRVRDHRRREVDGCAVREQPDDRLDGDEGEREPDQEPVTAEPPLVRVDEQGHRRCRRDPRSRAPQPPARRRTRPSGRKPSRRKPGMPAQQDSPERTAPSALSLASPRNRCSWSSHHCAPHSLKAMPQRRTRSTNGGSSPGRASIARSSSRYASCPRLRPSSSISPARGGRRPRRRTAAATRRGARPSSPYPRATPRARRARRRSGS